LEPKARNVMDAICLILYVNPIYLRLNRHTQRETKMSKLSNFEREKRYVVIKLKHLNEKEILSLEGKLEALKIRTVDCVVYESKWPCVDAVWKMVKNLSEGNFFNPFDRIAEIEAEKMSKLSELREKHECQDLKIIADTNGPFIINIKVEILSEVVVESKSIEFIEGYLEGFEAAVNSMLPAQWEGE